METVGTKSIDNFQRRQIMARKIRIGMFETNSSSCHSIVIGCKTPNQKLGDENGVITIEPDEFGWEIETYDDARTKASYCLTYAKQCQKEMCIV
jgi:hypothetical protein